MADDGDTIYAWQVQEPDGKWSMVGAMLGGHHSPLIHRSVDFIYRLWSLAETHATETGQPLRLARFSLAEVLEDSR